MASDHFVPQFYIRSFQAETGKVWCYERGIAPRLAAIKNVACEEDYYSIKAKHLENDKRRIDAVIGQLESNSAPILKTLLTASSMSLTNIERENLSVFIAHLSSRTPLFREKLKNLHLATHKTIARVSAENKQLFERQVKVAGIASTPDEVEELRQAILGIDNRVELEFTDDSDDYFLKNELEAALVVAPILYAKHWHIIESSTSRVFVTSDHPIVFLAASVDSSPSVRLGPEQAIVAFPLSPKRCLLMSNRPGRAAIIRVGREAVNEVNQEVIFHAHEQVFSNLSSRDFQRAFNKTNPGDNTKIVVE